MTSEIAHDDKRLLACIDLIGRTGAEGFQMRFSDEPDPVIWIAVAEWKQIHECGSGLNPLVAATRLIERAINGGLCAHCGKTCGASFDWERKQPLDDFICWFVYDPETAKFRRSCEGETKGRMYGRDPATGRPVGRNDKCPCNSGKKWKHCHGAAHPI